MDTTSPPTTVAKKLVVAGLPNPLRAGVFADITVTAVDDAGNPAAGYYARVVHVTSPGDSAALLPADFAFRVQDGATETTGVIFGTAGSQTVTVTDLKTHITGSQTVTVTSPAAYPQFYVANSSNSVTLYGPGAVANASPTGTIAGTNTGLNAPQGIARSVAGQLYVANSAGNSVTVYASGATGNATPVATIAGSNTGLNSPVGLALDAAGRIYVANNGTNSITVYAAGATGNATPTATIAGTSTGLHNPGSISVDASGRLYVANEQSDSITVYASGATGNAVPAATIAGTNTGLTSPVGIALDAVGRLYVVNRGYICDSSGDCNIIVVYAAGATGNAFPTATITSYWFSNWFDSPVGIAVDAAGRIFVVENASSYKVLVFPAGANGAVDPEAVIWGGRTGLKEPTFITF